MWLPLVRPLLGTWPATQACALGLFFFFSVSLLRTAVVVTDMENRLRPLPDLRVGDRKTMLITSHIFKETIKSPGWGDSVD